MCDGKTGGCTLPTSSCLSSFFPPSAPPHISYFWGYCRVRKKPANETLHRYVICQCRAAAAEPHSRLLPRLASCTISSPPLSHSEAVAAAAAPFAYPQSSRMYAAAPLGCARRYTPHPKHVSTCATEILRLTSEREEKSVGRFRSKGPSPSSRRKWRVGLMGGSAPNDLHHQ